MSANKTNSTSKKAARKRAKATAKKATTTRTAAAPKTDESVPPAKPYFNRELSWLAFDRRVLEQAQSSDAPLLERMKYLCFVNSNLDEFYEIRVAGLVQQVDAGINEVGMDGLSPKEVLNRVQIAASILVKDTYECWQTILKPALKEEKVFFKEKNELTKVEKKWIEEYFHQEVFPVLTPLAIDPSHPFPQISNKTLNLLIHLQDPKNKEDNRLMAILPIPRILPRVVHIKGASRRDVYIFLSDIIELFAHELFPGYKLKNSAAFRITRNSDLYINEEEAENLLEKIEDELSKMKRGDAVRLEIQQGMDETLLNTFIKAIDISAENIHTIDGPINLLRLMGVYDLIDRPDLKFESFAPHLPYKLSSGKNIFSTLKREDIFLHHPYDSFNPVVDFIDSAARDPQVFAIKQTLYRTGGDSPIVKALMEASERGKQVTVLVELKARFDELNNIQWARQLEEMGVHVVYGMLGLKTHCKCCMVVRREKSGLRRYVHLGTGNYNHKTARLYTDCSLITARENITDEIADLFNTLTGFAKEPQFEKLLIAPFNLHSQMQELILNEKKNALAGKPARIIIKCNSLIDKASIDNLYEASQAGVKIDLIIRGICGLVPGVKGVSENIHVRSILGRFLEHSRIFYFKNTGGSPHIYMGSADWMPRNFYRRIEEVFPVENRNIRKRILEILKTQLSDTAQAKVLKPNGTYVRPALSRHKTRFDSQQWFIDQAKESSILAEFEFKEKEAEKK